MKIFGIIIVFIIFTAYHRPSKEYVVIEVNNCGMASYWDNSKKSYTHASNLQIAINELCGNGFKMCDIESVNQYQHGVLIVIMER